MPFIQKVKLEINSIEIDLIYKRGCSMRKIKLNKDTEMTVDVIKYVLDLHKEEAKRINKLKDY